MQLVAIGSCRPGEDLTREGLMMLTGLSCLEIQDVDSSREVANVYGI
jgi:hypothetical protein